MKSFNTYDNEIREYILRSFPSRDIPVLDIGAGSGKFRKLLFDFPNVDGVEVWEPYIESYQLNQMYRKLHNVDIRKFNKKKLAKYPLVIMGDILEHLTVKSAQKVLSNITGTLIVAVPYEYEQPAVNGNEHEFHEQADLTHQNFMERYPGFTVLAQDDRYGIYYRTSNADAEVQRQPKQVQAAVDLDRYKNANICIATPVSGQCTVNYTIGLANSVKQFADWGIRLGFAMVAGHSVQGARNRLVSSFMADGAFTHLLFIDADHGWDPQNILRLLAMDRDMIGIIARKKTPEVQWAANIPEGSIDIQDGAMNLGDGDMGTGFLMIKRNVFERMFAAYPDLKIDHPDEHEARPEEHENYYSLFQFLIEDGVERSEDITFCRRWKAIGGQIWCDPSAAISHIGSYDYRGSVSTLFKKLEQVA